MIQWLELPRERRIEIINQVSINTGFVVEAIEKDWWVTLALRAVFNTEWAAYLVFKGGTSLSKGWGLITRFSEDVDLAMDRQVLGFTEETPSQSQVERLRQLSAAFMGGPFLHGLEAAIRALGVPEDQLQIIATEIKSNNTDPRKIELRYNSLFVTEEEAQKPGYLKPHVEIEIGARSLKEPFSNRSITSLISNLFPTASFAENAFDIPTVEPQRTMLEKMLLLHEEKKKAPDKRRTFRYSRHFYDLYCMTNTEFEERILKGKDLFNAVIQHRKHFNKVKEVDYESLECRYLDFLPAEEDMPLWEQDYTEMQKNMIGANPPNFPTLMDSIRNLTSRLSPLDF
jgi:hypothetical protein